MSSDTDRTTTIVEQLARIWLIWAIAYLVTDIFKATVDHVDSLWIKFVFLNIPLQLALALLALMLVRSEPSSQKALGLAIAIVNTALIGGHIVTTIAIL